MRKLKADKISQIRAVWLETENVQETARICQVHEKTIRAYLKKENWPEQLVRRRQIVERKMDESAASRRARQLKYTRAIQTAGMMYFVDPKTGEIRNRIRKDTAAVRAVTEGIRLEREILGDEGAVLEIKLKLPTGYEEI